jgi:hypothetical protein
VWTAAHADSRHPALVVTLPTMMTTLTMKAMMAMTVWMCVLVVAVRVVVVPATVSECA